MLDKSRRRAASTTTIRRPAAISAVAIGAMSAAAVILTRSRRGGVLLLLLLAKGPLQRADLRDAADAPLHNRLLQPILDALPDRSRQQRNDVAKGLGLSHC